MDAQIAQVASIRHRLWDAGFRPVPVLTGDKRPLGKEWTDRARLDPPECVRFDPVVHALSTGILCDGLRAIDYDIDDKDVAQKCRSIAADMLGEAPIRFRRNSPRFLALYRAEDGSPPKVVLAGKFGKIEILGKGQQFVAFGTHPTGADLEWFPDPPGAEPLSALPAVSEELLHAFLVACAPIVGAETPQKVNGAPRQTGKLQADPLRVAAALDAIPNTGPADWEKWNRIGMAIWNATGGSEIGRHAWAAWSSRHPSYDPGETDRRWQHYFTSPPSRVGAGSIFFDAARQGNNQDRPPHEPDAAANGHYDPSYLDALARDAAEDAAMADHAPEADRTAGPHAKPAVSELPLLWFKDIEPVLDARDFVQGVLMEQGAAVVYGQSNSGKTFWTTTLALCVAAGGDWHGLRVEQGGVVYCALEGSFGFRNRVTAWREERGLDSYALPFVAIPCSLNLLDAESDVELLIGAVAAARSKMNVPIKLIVIDTLARALAGGNENAPDDMGALVKNMDRIRESTGAMVLFVHHSGKDQARGARGHSSLQAAIDTEIEITVDDDGNDRRATVVKQREMRKGQVFPFTLRVVMLGQNRYGEPITTCVVEAGDGQAAGAAPVHRRLTGHNKRALEVLADLVATSGQAGYPGVPSGHTSVPEKWWRERFYERAMPGSDEEAKRKAFRRAADALIEARRVGMASNRVWLPTRKEGHNDVPE